MKRIILPLFSIGLVAVVSMHVVHPAQTMQRSNIMGGLRTAGSGLQYGYKQAKGALGATGRWLKNHPKTTAGLASSTALAVGLGAGYLAKKHEIPSKIKRVWDLRHETKKDFGRWWSTMADKLGMDQWVLQRKMEELENLKSENVQLKRELNKKDDILNSIEEELGKPFLQQITESMGRAGRRLSKWWSNRPSTLPIGQ